MTRRDALLAALSVPLGSWTAVKLSAAEPAHLTISLDQWAGITFTHGTKTLTLSGAEIFRILAGGKQ